jgi:hypothetical protein
LRLVLLATSGNQSYIFASNRLREAVGASYLVACSTTDWIDDACREVGGTRLQASSGNALVTTPDTDADTAKELVRKVTSRALKDAPGLSVTGVSVKIEGDTPTADDITNVFMEWQLHSGRTASATATRFHRLPAVAACRSTDWPAAAWYTDLPHLDGKHPEDQNPIPQSAEVIAKRKVRPEANQRMKELVGGTPLVDIRDFHSKVDWVGVIHADGNRLGELFRNAPGALAGADHPNPLGRLSEEVRERAESALRQAVAAVAPDRKQELPLVPLIVGGDDLTVLIDGRLALEFTAAYLNAFGEPVSEDSMLHRVLGDRKALTACAGVALVKPQYPFSEAYRLAEDLCQSAKQQVRDHAGTHGLDVHVLLDSQARPLDQIRAALKTDHGMPLTDRPYLIPASGEVSVPDRRDWERAVTRIRTIAARPPEGTVVSPTQLHHLREELRTDSDLVRRRLATLRQRATEDDQERLDALCPDGDDTLSGLYDLLDLAPFVGGGSR